MDMLRKLQIHRMSDNSSSEPIYNRDIDASLRGHRETIGVLGDYSR